MGAKQLAIVLAPNILRCNQSGLDAGALVGVMASCNQVIFKLINMVVDCEGFLVSFSDPLLLLSSTGNLDPTRKTIAANNEEVKSALQKFVPPTLPKQRTPLTELKPPTGFVAPSQPVTPPKKVILKAVNSGDPRADNTVDRLQVGLTHTTSEGAIPVMNRAVKSSLDPPKSQLTVSDSSVPITEFETLKTHRSLDIPSSDPVPMNSEAPASEPPTTKAESLPEKNAFPEFNIDVEETITIVEEANVVCMKSNPRKATIDGTNDHILKRKSLPLPEDTAPDPPKIKASDSGSWKRGILAYAQTTPENP
jgi:hypothetical protein